MVMQKLYEVNGKFFGKKEDAKVFRDMQGGHVSYGPDHWKSQLPKKTHNGSKDAKN